jgi:hypothetical protein
MSGYSREELKRMIAPWDPAHPDYRPEDYEDQEPEEREEREEDDGE